MRRKTRPVDAAPEEVAACARLIDEKKGEEIAILDTRRYTLVDYFLIATAQSGRHLKALAEEIERLLKRRRAAPCRAEGTPQSGWILVDAGDFVVHLFLPETRRYYDLEMLWGDVPRVAWDARPTAAPAAGRRAPDA